ncbi:GNAT family protein [Massilia sp. YIM B02763]|uniref:GNAT family N-acetyltransferase n=1 Tax=Massilia sp. YIM B02763 TaxID=3050130 RepID=UPI0025B64E7C|nr:GNAT family protein [Massilia sp. YIM B02763]MDN4051575.1 GNAT family protein [Massilia sp. YIM B02763]
MTVSLAPPAAADVEPLLAFELANRAFFEAHINARPAAYYSRDGVARAIAAAQADALADRGYQFLVRDAQGALVGRVNLGHVKRAHFHSAVLGYRIGADFGGRGHAGAAVGRLLAIGFGDLGLRRIEADASVANVASQRVLRRNGFVEYGRSRRSFELDGTWYDRVHFERHADTGLAVPAREGA